MDFDGPCYGFQSKPDERKAIQPTIDLEGFRSRTAIGVRGVFYMGDRLVFSQSGRRYRGHRYEIYRRIHLQDLHKQKGKTRHPFQG